MLDYQFWMTFSWTLLSLRPYYGAVFSLFYISCDFFFSPLYVVWLCLTFVNILACVASKGISWKDTKIMGSHLFFFLTKAVLNSVLPLYKFLQGVSPQMQYFGLVSFLFKKQNRIKLEACVWAWVPIWLIGEVHMIVKMGELSCSIMLMV